MTPVRRLFSLDQIQREADQLRQETFVGESLPVDLAAISEMLDIQVELVPGLPALGISSIERGQGVIRIRAGLEEGLLRFTWAHELGHHRLHLPQGCNDGDLGVEQEADRFASALLFPNGPFAAHLQELGRNVSLDSVAQLAGIYQTSMSATANRFAFLHHEPVAHVVASFNEPSEPIIRYMFTSKEFDALGLPLRQKMPLPRYSNAMARIAERDVMSPWVLAKHWFPSGRFHQQQKLYEDVRLSKSFREAYILLWFAEIREE